MMDSGVMFVSVGFFLLTVCSVTATTTTVTTTPTSTVTGGNQTSTVTGGNQTSTVTGGNQTSTVTGDNPTRGNPTNATISVSSTDSTAPTSTVVTSGITTVSSSSSTVITSSIASSSQSQSKIEKMERDKLRRKNINNGIAAIVVVIGSILLISIASCTSKLDKPTRKIVHETIGHIEQRGQNLRTCDSIENIRTAL